jgi:hypothetical protein
VIGVCGSENQRKEAIFQRFNNYAVIIIPLLNTYAAVAPPAREAPLGLITDVCAFLLLFFF